MGWTTNRGSSSSVSSPFAADDVKGIITWSWNSWQLIEYSWKCITRKINFKLRVCKYSNFDFLTQNWLESLIKAQTSKLSFLRPRSNKWQTLSVSQLFKCSEASTLWQCIKVTHRNDNIIVQYWELSLVYTCWLYLQLLLISRRH